jgi:hypothetical protein
MHSDSSVELVDLKSHLDMGGKDEAEQAHNTAFAWVKVLARPTENINQVLDRINAHEDGVPLIIYQHRVLKLATKTMLRCQGFCWYKCP